MSSHSILICRHEDYTVATILYHSCMLLLKFVVCSGYRAVFFVCFLHSVRTKMLKHLHISICCNLYSKLKYYPTSVLLGTENCCTHFEIRKLIFKKI